MTKRTTDFSLVGELPELTAAMERLAALAAPDVTFTVADFGGVRTEAQTVQILKYRDADYAVYVKRCEAKGETPKAINDFRRIAPFGKSMHNWGGARDLRPLTWRGQWVVDENDYSKIIDERGFQAAHDLLDHYCVTDPELKATLKIGDYFNDEPHVELAISLDECRRRYIARLNANLPPAA